MVQDTPLPARPDGVVVVPGGGGLPLPLVDGEGTAVALVWPGMGAQHRTMHRLRLDPGDATVTQRHDGEAVYGVVEGEATVVDEATGESAELTTGAMVHLDPGTPYRFRAGPDGALVVGGPCPPDGSLYDAATEEAP